MVVEELMMQNMVLFRNRRYILGDTDLFINTQCPFNPEIEKLKQFYHELSESPRIASIATQKWHSLEGAYLHNSSNIKSGHTIAQIFSLVYFLVYGEDYRPYTGKEIGQFNSLFRFFGGVSSVKMIVMYVSEAVNPNPGQLLIQKDKIYHKDCQPGKKATSIKSTIGSHEEAFK